MEALQNLNPWLLALVRVVLIVGFLLSIVPGLIWWERRLLSWMQDRIGPNRVGPYGLLQPIADGVKLFFKEDITPSSIDRLIYFVAPAIALFPAFTLAAVLPWGPAQGAYAYLTPIADVNIGVLYMLAISSLGVYGLVLAGYGSDNKYSLLGGLRASAQLISYELAMGVSLGAIVLATGSLKITDMVVAQEGALWGLIPALQNWNLFTPFGFVAMVVFLICMVAETNRAPFDLPEAENELIAGYHTEYSSMKFAVFFMGEYAAMLVFSGVVTAVFLGGYNLLPVNWEAMNLGFMQRVNDLGAPVWFIGKSAFVFSCYVWLRATLPRLRYDQLMSLGWKSLLPIAAANLILVASWIVVTEIYGAMIGWGFLLGAMFLATLFFLAMQRSSRALESRELLLVDEAQPRTIELVDPGKAVS